MYDFTSERSDVKSRKSRDTRPRIRSGNMDEARGMFSGLLPCRPKGVSASAVVGQLVGQSSPRFHSEVKSRTRACSFPFSATRRAERRTTSSQRHAPGQTANDFLSTPHIEVVRVERMQGRTSDYFFSAPRAEGGAGTARAGPNTPCTPAYRWTRSRGRCFGDPVCAARRDGSRRRAQTEGPRSAHPAEHPPVRLPKRSPGEAPTGAAPKHSHGNVPTGAADAFSIRRTDGRMVPISTGRYWARGCAFMYSSFRRSMETWV